LDLFFGEPDKFEEPDKNVFKDKETCKIKISTKAPPTASHNHTGLKTIQPNRRLEIIKAGNKQPLRDELR
jgi:hypothetical protein